MRCVAVAAVRLLLLPTVTIAAEAGNNCVPVRVKKAYPPRYPPELEAEKAQGETLVRLRVGADARIPCGRRRWQGPMRSRAGHD